MYIAVDIGGTNTRVATVQSLSQPVFIGEPIRRRNSTDYEADIAFIIDAARKLGGDTVAGIGVGIVGTMDKARTRSLHSKNNAHWNNKPFVDRLAAEFGCPVVADNDGVVAALGEAYYGSVKSDFAYVIWGTGIGGALVVHDQHGTPTVEKLDWGKYFGKWEYDCGGKELALTYGKQPEDLTDNEWQTVIDKFRKRAVAFARVIQPKAIVFGGGLSVRHKEELEAMADVLGVPCHVTKFDGDSGLYGGLALIRSRA
jgi:hypothetical protein